MCFHEKKLLFKYIQITPVMENGSELCSNVSGSFPKKLYKSFGIHVYWTKFFLKIYNILSNSIAKVATQIRYNWRLFGALRQKSFTTKCPHGKQSCGEVSLRAKCPHGEVSLRQSVLSAKCPYGGMSWAICPTAKNPNAKSPETEHVYVCVYGYKLISKALYI